MADDPTPNVTPPHELPSLSRPEGSHGGSWGEHHSPEGPVSVSSGLHHFEQLARVTHRLADDSNTDIEQPSPSHPELTPHDTDGGFNLRQWIENRNSVEESQGIPHKRMGLSWRDLSVYAPSGSSTSFIKTLPEAILGSFGLDALNFVRNVFAQSNKKKDLDSRNMKMIIGGHEGVLKPGEMLLVLGRPGSGCSTFLQAVTSSLPSSLTLHPSSTISYGGFSPSEITRKLRGEVVYSGEDDLHYPHLSVERTLRFALRNKVPRGQKRLIGESRDMFIERCVDVLLKMFRISHVKETIVGDS